MTWTPKVGMKVRCLSERINGFQKDSVKEVTGVGLHDGHCYLRFDGRDHGWIQEFFEPIDDSPPLPSYDAEVMQAKGVYHGLNGQEVLWEFRKEGTVDTYATLGAEIGRLVTEKQKAYGDSFGKAGDVLRSMYPDGVKPEQFDDLLTITRVLDKLYRIATDKDAFGESPWKDIVGYGLLSVAKAKKP